MGEYGQNQHFCQTDHSYSNFFGQSNYIQSKLGQKYLLGAFDKYTRAVTGQKKAKNEPKWPKSAFLSKTS